MGVDVGVVDIDEIEHGEAIDGAINTTHGGGKDGGDDDSLEADREEVGNEVGIDGVAVGGGDISR